MGNVNVSSASGLLGKIPFSPAPDLFLGCWKWGQKVTQHFSALSLSPQLQLNHHSNGCHVFLPHHLHLLSPLSFCSPLYLSLSLSPLMHYYSSLPHRDWAGAPASAHFERCCRPKNVRSKHTRAVFIINQLYGSLMEVISVKFMPRDLAVLSKQLEMW